MSEVIQRAILVLALLVSSPQWAAEPTPALVELSAEATRAASNDSVRASCYAEAADARPAEAARKANAAVAAALDMAHAYPAVKVRTANTSTFPVYAQGNARVEAWRVRTELIFESTELSKVAELLGRLQETLAVGQLIVVPSAATRRTVEDAATLDALAAFRDKARMVATALGQDYRLRSLSIGPVAGHIPTPRPVLRAAAPAAIPIEAGDSAISVTVSGQIELVPSR